MEDTLFAFAVILSAGVLFKHFYGNADAVKEAVNALVLRVLLPALCIKTFATAGIDLSILLVPASAWIVITSVTVIGFVALRLLSKFFVIYDNEAGVLILITSFGNLIYLGAPVLSALYGIESVKYALLYDFLAGTILVWTLGAFVASYYGDKGSFNIKSSVKTILTLPPLWGIAGGILINWSGLELKGFMMKSLEMLGGAVTPLMILSISLSLKIPPLKYAFVLLPFVFIKLVLSPLIAYYVTGFINMEGLARKAAIMESAMPVMILLLIVANRYKLNESLTALAITLSTALSFITLPLAAYLLNLFV